jgi:hypothetical protein
VTWFGLFNRAPLAGSPHSCHKNPHSRKRRHSSCGRAAPWRVAGVVPRKGARCVATPAHLPAPLQQVPTVAYCNLSPSSLAPSVCSMHGAKVGLAGLRCDQRARKGQPSSRGRCLKSAKARKSAGFQWRPRGATLRVHAEQLLMNWSRVSLSVIRGFGSSGWIRTSKPPVNSRNKRR